MSFTVAIPQDISNAGKDYLSEKGYRLVVGSGPAGPDEIKRLIAGADAILARTNPFPREVLEAAAKLRVIGRHGIGVDNIDVPYCTQRGIWVTHTPNANAVSVAEHVMGFLVAIARGFAFMDRETRAGNWEIRNQRKGVDLDGKTLGVVGLGRIGKLVAEKARAAFNMEILGFDAIIKPENYPAGVAAAATEDIFARADFVTLHVPAVAGTRGMVDAKLLARMKKTAFLINCARGEIVKEGDLHDALANHRIAGAAIDVYETEPPRPDNPLFRLDNLLATPHSAALTAEAMDRMGLHAAMGIHAVLSGGKPEWPVNQPAAPAK
ncbi:MAG: hydroxyacid dehydrogenase [Planctomycetota bacterium]|jgi:D-3-phosphoglycerate dehydrogenase|nr:hydroxyacid dehydrogenase [Planctomycetota bacterium]